MHGVLLINLGTPNSFSKKDVRRYLHQFLTDKRVIDVPWLIRQWLVRAIIVPKRLKTSSESYREIWTEEGSPLKLYGYRVKEALQNRLGDEYTVELAMRYQNPSIDFGIQALLKKEISSLTIIPLFPQYASATTGSVYEEVMRVLKKAHTIPEIKWISSYPTHPLFIQAFAARIREYWNNHDHILFSFHGLPERQLQKCDDKGHCLKKENCCQTRTSKNFHCYSAQCYDTAQALVETLGIAKDKTSICFQSRLGKEPWLKPYASEEIERLAKENKKNVLVICPSFVADCLETIYEIGNEYNHEFQKAGGRRLTLVPSLNEHPIWIETLHSLVKQ